MLSRFLVMLGMLAASQAARASYVYIYDGHDFGHPLHFEFIEPTILTSDTTIDVAQMQNVSGDNAQFLTKAEITGPNTNDPNILFYFTFSQFPGADTGWFKAFDHVGTYCNGACLAPATTLTIAEAPTQNAPEPATLVLMGLGMVGLACVRRRSMNYVLNGEAPSVENQS